LSKIIFCNSITCNSSSSPIITSISPYQARIYAWAPGARAQGGKFSGAAY